MNSWKDNASKQNTYVPSDAVRGQDTFGPNAIQVTNPMGETLPATKLVVDETRPA